LKPGAKLKLWDPVAEERFAEIFPGRRRYFKDPARMPAEGRRLAALILTDWPEVKKLDLDQLKSVMKCPVIVDGRNVFDPKAVRAKGFTYHLGGPGISGRIGVGIGIDPETRFRPRYRFSEP
jgi:UDPglucose 6-dehydrogenase